MSKNIKEIGKELLGKSLNSFHRKTGLTQLERNNEMQDGILDGILSQVDDAYIEKTEQSNVIHLDGSGDGVVVLDSIEGNTMVNHINSQSLRDWKYAHNTYIGQYANTQEFGIDWSKGVSFNCWLQARNDSNPIFSTLKPNTNYTVWINILENNPTLDGVPVTNNVGGLQLWINGYQSVRQSLPINTTGWVSFNYRWTREDNSINYSIFGLNILGTNPDGTKTINGGKLRISKEVIVLEGVDKPLNSYFEGIQSSFEEKVNDDSKYEVEIVLNNRNLFDGKLSSKPPHKQNKIKLLINEPLRSTPHNISDRLCIKDKRLVVERKCGEITLDGSEDWALDQCFETFGQVRIRHIAFDRKNKPRNKLYSSHYTQCKIYSDNMKNAPKLTNNSTENLDTVFAGDSEYYALLVKFKNSTLGLNDGVNVANFISKVKEYLQNKNVTVVYELVTPYYEEVLNEYGEPIILEGYENGTLYIDSTIVPTTTVRYTPKMESFKTLKEVNNNNIMLTNDVNDTIIPYMMEVDLMIMGKEMALPSQINNRKVEVLDMTSMQKRTQEMLERLIKGKTLTEQECKTRVTTYLNAGKITDEQAEELMLVISEIYN